MPKIIKHAKLNVCVLSNAHFRIKLAGNITPKDHLIHISNASIRLLKWRLWEPKVAESACASGTAAHTHTHTHISLAWFKACVCVLRARRAISKQCAAFVGRSLNGWMPLIMPLLSPFNCLRDSVGRKCFSADFLQTSLITLYIVYVYAIHMRHLVYLTFHIEWCACQQSY